ncbi:MAG: LacI family DNA-binding transcriptional regulator [Chitinophagales bacterium]
MPTRSRRPTIREVARLAGVSTATVSYVLNDSAAITAETRRRVQEAIERLGYHPSGLARGLAGKATRTIGVLLPAASSGGDEHSVTQALAGISEAVWSSPYTLLLSPAAGRSVAVFREKGAEGLLCFAGRDEECLAEAVRLGFPAVSLGQSPHPVPWVDTDHRRAGREVALHLLRLGHTQLALLSGGRPVTGAAERRQGFLEALAAHQLPVEPDLLLTAEPTFQGGYQAMDQLLALGARPGAVVCHSDTMALGAIRAARNKGLAIPQDLAVVGFGDEPFAAYGEPPLTTVREPLAQLGRRAAQLLLELLATPDRPPAPAGELLPAKLVVRESCGSLMWI